MAARTLSIRRRARSSGTAKGSVAAGRGSHVTVADGTRHHAELSYDPLVFAVVQGDLVVPGGESDAIGGGTGFSQVGSRELRARQLSTRW